ncbi:MAG: S41 family peptidase [Rikenellaceae bacterium]
MKLRFLAFIAVIVLALCSISGLRKDFTLVQSTEQVINLMRELSSNYVDEVDASKLLKEAAGAMTSSMDPYTSYLPEEEMKDFEIMTTGKYGGIGSIIRQKGSRVVVAQPYEGSPADKAGLKIGDRFVKIAGEDARGFTTSKASSLLKGSPGSKVIVEVESVYDTTQVREVVLKRERIAIPPIPYYGYIGGSDDAIGYIKHTDFTDGCYQSMRDALVKLSKRPLKGLVLDYRGNGGGIMQEAVDILSLFVPQGTEVLSIKGRREQTTYKTSKRPIAVDLPIIVLIDGASASAAEIVAGALQDLDRAVLIGERSYGKGLVQSTLPVGYNSYLKLTTAKYYIPSGRCIQAIDYSKGGGIREKVADSLRREFKTAAGRKVLDGGGVTPDITIRHTRTSRFASQIYAMGYIDDFGDDFTRRHQGETLAVEGFSLSDEEYNLFMAFLFERDVPYKSQTRKALEDLKKVAKSEKQSALIAQVTQMERALKDDKKNNMLTYKDEIVELIEQDIILRHSYLSGVIRNSLLDDKLIKRSLEILTKPQAWEQSLVGHKE